MSKQHLNNAPIGLDAVPMILADAVITTIACYFPAGTKSSRYYSLSDALSVRHGRQ